MRRSRKRAAQQSNQRRDSTPPPHTTAEATAMPAMVATSSPLAEVNGEKVIGRRPSVPKMSNRFTSIFSTSPKNKIIFPSEKRLGISGPTLSLPTICLSNATSEKSLKGEDDVTTLYEPPSYEETMRIARQEAQFGPLLSKKHLYHSKFEGGAFPEPVEDEPPYFYVLTTYFSYLILIVIGHVRDFFSKRFKPSKNAHIMEQNGLAPLVSDFDSFYTRRLKFRLNDCFSRPTTGVPGRFITLLDRAWTKEGDWSMEFTGSSTETLNLSSYNYLGFAQSEGPCADAVEQTIKKYGTSVVSPRGDAGTSDLHVEVEELIAKFVGKPAAMVFSMGFGTNAAVFSSLVGKGCLIISDELNHSSIRFGSRLSGAMVRTFKHNNMHDLERLLREVIVDGQPRTHRPWRKILIAVEGLYSMEGTMCNLPGLIELKKRYKFNLFIDEAHSIGALGPNGAGICDYFGISPAEVDILMGTLTKSFGANGGYIAASPEIIEKLRITNSATLYAEAPSPYVLTQIACSLRLIKGEVTPGQGKERLQRLAWNSRYLRLGLKRLGFIVYGHDDSPIIPLLLYHPAKMSAFSHEMLRRGISVVVVGYPATPLVSARARFCVSAAHNKEDLDRVLTACDEFGDVIKIRYSSGVAGGAYYDTTIATPLSLPTSQGTDKAKELKLQQQNKLRTKKRAHGSVTVTPPRWPLAEVLKRGEDDVQLPLR